MTRLKHNDYERRWDNNKRKWTYLHREIIENYIKRKLSSDEHVHHINGNHKDNRLDNLQIITRAEHARISRNKRSLHPHCDIIGCEKPHHAKGFCRYHYRRIYDHLWHANRY